MTIQEAIKSNRLFKRKGWRSIWLKIEYDEIVDADTSELFPLDVSDILADDWIIKEEWYDGDFKKKYPNGVFCKVRNGDRWYYDVIKSYDPNGLHPFYGILDVWDVAKPIPKEEMPYILKEGKD